MSWSDKNNILVIMISCSCFYFSTAADFLSYRPPYQQPNETSADEGGNRTIMRIKHGGNMVHQRPEKTKRRNTAEADNK